MKKINFFVNSFPKTSETFIYNKVKGLLENDFEITVIASSVVNDEKGFYKSLNNFPNFNLVLAPISNPKNISYLIGAIVSPLFYIKLKQNSLNIKSAYKSFLKFKTLNYNNPDIIHFAFSGIGFNYLSELKELKNVKIGSSFRGAAEKIKPLINTKRAQKFPFFLKTIDYYHCVSFNMFKELEKYGADKSKLFVNYPSIDTQLFSFNKNYSLKNNSKIKLISVGRLHWKKGIDIALLTLQKLKKSGYNNFEYKIVGNGNEYEKLKFMVHNLQLQSNVTFLGFQPKNKISRLLKKSSVFLLPSYSEGLSNAALEAMCVGVPVVSAKAGGMQEAITHNKTGLLFEIGNVEELYLNLKAIFEENINLDKMRIEANRTVVNKFDLKIQKEKFNLFFKNLI